MKRQSNIEILRILAMFMIIGSHLAGHGVQQQLNPETAFKVWGTGPMLNKIVTVAMIPGGGVGVALFFIITGYFQIDKKTISLKRVITETVFYGWLLSFLIVGLRIFGIKIDISPLAFIKQLINPNLSGVWWFVTVYIIVLLNSLWINSYINDVGGKKFLVVLCLFWIVGYCFPQFNGSMYFDLYRGVFFYCIGALLKRLKISNCKGKIPVNLITCAISWIIGTCLCYFFSTAELYGENVKWKLVGMTSRTFFWAIVIPVCAVSLFVVFDLIKINTNIAVNKIASTVFASYLISDSEVVRNYLWNEIFHIKDFWFLTSIFPLFAILCSVLIMIVCSLIDIVRQRWIEPVYLKRINLIIDRFNAFFA